MRRHFVRGSLLIALATGMAGSASCTMRDGDGNSYLIINSLQGFSGATEEETGNNLQSDVVTKGGVLEDEGIVSFSLALKDPGPSGSPTSPSQNNFITLERARVTYIRSDGRNTPGVDVPFPFDTMFTVTVGGGEATEANFTLVRVQAKLEAPLLALRNLNGAIAISTIAEVTFYGRDQAGRLVTAVGRIAVDFADFADPD
jgi:hypothetical protein